MQKSEVRMSDYDNDDDNDQVFMVSRVKSTKNKSTINASSPLSHAWTASTTLRSWQANLAVTLRKAQGAEFY